MLATTADPPQADLEFAVRAPTRIDFGGGWTDVPPYDVEQGGFVCNVAISRYATVRVRPTPGETSPEPFVEHRHDASLLHAAASRYRVTGAQMSLTSDFPVAAGLGGSSAAGVASIAAIFKWLRASHRRDEVAEASRDLEVNELGNAGGRQDHYAAAFGGALGIRFSERVSVERIALSAAVLTELPRRCIVVYTGESRISGGTITAVMGAYRAGVPAVCSALNRMRELAEQMARALAGGDLDEVGALVGEHWQHQRSLDATIPTPLIDALVARATAAGALGCKALGASGGGCVLIVAPSNRVEEVRRAVEPLGITIDYSVDTQGVSECP